LFAGLHKIAARQIASLKQVYEDQKNLSYGHIDHLKINIWTDRWTDISIAVILLYLDYKLVSKNQGGTG